MDAVFTLPYPELIVAETLARKFPKGAGFSISLPLSRQQKGYDLLIYSKKTKKVATIQVKAAKVFVSKPPKRTTKEKYNFTLLFKKFAAEKGSADFYAFFSVYPKKDITQKGLRRKQQPQSWWHHKILLFTDKDMQRFLKSLTDKHFFYISFNHNEPKVFLTRGTRTKEELTSFTFERRAYLLEKFLK